MKFADITGNSDVKAALVRMADSGRVPHALMFHENEGCGALALAVAFMQYLNCMHHSGVDSCGTCPSCNQISKLIYPDIHFVFPVAGEKVTSENFIQKFIKDMKAFGCSKRVAGCFFAFTQNNT